MLRLLASQLRTEFVVDARSPTFVDERSMIGHNIADFVGEAE